MALKRVGNQKKGTVKHVSLMGAKRAKAFCEGGSKEGIIKGSDDFFNGK